MLKTLTTGLRFGLQKRKIQNIPFLRQFVTESHPKLNKTNKEGLTFHIETYGCQMNVNDSEIVRSVLSQKYTEVQSADQADMVLINTCAIRQKAEERVLTRIKQIKNRSAVAILGCMAERLKKKMFQHGAQIVCGPDAYRDLPRLMDLAIEGHGGQMNVALSAQQTYADIAPVRHNPNSVSAFLSIMRGCNNMCSFCIVPFVRGRERSRKLSTILEEIGKLQAQGVRDITFLGQNVNSYHDTSTQPDDPSTAKHTNSQGFSQTFKLRDHPGARFANLLQAAAISYPNVRFRFTSPHPKDFPLQVLEVIKKYPNICNFIHLPAQSGNTEVLMRMRRNHSREAYLQLVDRIRQTIPDVAISTDMIAGFCHETDAQFQDTISLLKTVKYDMAFLFAYSMREKTHAHRNYQDDVPEQTKQKRLKRMIEVFLEEQADSNAKQIGKVHLLLMESKSKRVENVLTGKTDNFKTGYVKVREVPVYENGKIVGQRQFKWGDYLAVRVDRVAPRALYCSPIGITSTLTEFYSNRDFFEKAPSLQQELPTLQANKHSLGGQTNPTLLNELL